MSSVNHNMYFEIYNTVLQYLRLHVTELLHAIVRPTCTLHMVAAEPVARPWARLISEAFMQQQYIIEMGRKYHQKIK